MPFGHLHFSVDIDGDRELSRRLSGFIARIEDWRSFFEYVLVDWQFTQQQLFMLEGAFEGQSRWTTLGDAYEAWKARHWPGAKILERTGELREATTNPVTVITATEMRLTVDSDYAIYHQSSRPRTSTLPRRAFASLTAKQKSRWVGFLRKHIWDEEG